MIRVARTHLALMVICGLVAGFAFGTLLVTPPAAHCSELGQLPTLSAK